jgi:hypothetical protein
MGPSPDNRQPFSTRILNGFQAARRMPGTARLE